MNRKDDRSGEEADSAAVATAAEEAVADTEIAEAQAAATDKGHTSFKV